MKQNHESNEKTTPYQDIPMFVTYAKPTSTNRKPESMVGKYWRIYSIKAWGVAKTIKRKAIKLFG